MGMTRKILDNLSLDNVGQNGKDVLVLGALGFAGWALKEDQNQSSANIVASLTAAAFWLSGVAKHIGVFKAIDDYVTRNGNVERSWRTKVAGGLALGAIGTFCGFARESGIPGQEMTTVALAATSGVLMHVSGLFHQEEAKAARMGLLTKKVAEQNVDNNYIRLEAGEGSAANASASASAPAYK